MENKMLLSISEAAATLGISRPTVYQLIHADDKVSLRDGAAHIITSQGRVVFFMLKNLHAFPLDL